MQLSLEQKRNMRHYAYVNGFRNAAWLTGYVEEIRENCLFISQNGYKNTAVMVFFDAKTQPKGVKQGSAISVICRVQGHKQGGDRIPVLRVLGYERPKLINMPPATAYQIALKHNAPASQVKPSTAAPKTVNPRLNPNSNIVHLAGLVEACVPLPSSKNPGLVVLIKQHRENDQAVPVRLYGQMMSSYKSRLKRGMPIMVEGMARMRIEDVADGQGGVTQTLVPFIQTSDIRIPQRGSEFLYIPGWAGEFMYETAGSTELKDMIKSMLDEGGENISTADAHEGEGVMDSAVAAATPSLSPILASPTFDDL